MDSLYRYAGIGSRQTPEEVQMVMCHIALTLNSQFYLLTGINYGADRAFSESLTKNCQIFTKEDIMQDRFGNAQEALKLAGQVQPFWERCSIYERAFIAQNCYKVLGSDLKSPVDFIICWTNDGEIVGSTATALRIAKLYGIPVINLGKENVLQNVAQSLHNGSFELKIINWLEARK